MNYPQNLSIPILQMRPRINPTGWNKSDSNIKIHSPNLSSFNIRNEKMFAPSQIPFAIKKLERNPKDILEKRAAMTERDGKEKFFHMDGHDQVIKNGNGDRFDTVPYKNISEKSQDLEDLSKKTFINGVVIC